MLAGFAALAGVPFVAASSTFCWAASMASEDTPVQVAQGEALRPWDPSSSPVLSSLGGLCPCSLSPPAATLRQSSCPAAPLPVAPLPARGPQLSPCRLETALLRTSAFSQACRRSRKGTKGRDLVRLRLDVGNTLSQLAKVHSGQAPPEKRLTAQAHAEPFYGAL